MNLVTDPKSFTGYPLHSPIRISPNFQLLKLDYLFLGFTKVSDAGLVHLKGMANLETLILSDTKVTDAGLVHLKTLTNLRDLDLRNTKVTDEGVKGLQVALPKCQIEWK